jgi:hypothetical protein
MTCPRTSYVLHLPAGVLVAESITELTELVASAIKAGDEILLVRAHEPRPRPLAPVELETLIHRLTR